MPGRHTTMLPGHSNAAFEGSVMCHRADSTKSSQHIFLALQCHAWLLAE